MANKKKKKHLAPAAQPAEKRVPADCPAQPPRTAKLMGALCYLNVLILILPAAGGGTMIS